MQWHAVSHYTFTPIHTYCDFDCYNNDNFIPIFVTFSLVWLKHRLWLFVKRCGSNLCFKAKGRKTIYTPINPTSVGEERVNLSAVVYL